MTGGITHVVTWRPARACLGETTGFWNLLDIDGYLDDGGRCDLSSASLDAGLDLSPAGLLAWLESAACFTVSLSPVTGAEPEHRHQGDPAITSVFWVRRAER